MGKNKPYKKTGGLEHISKLRIIKRGEEFIVEHKPQVISIFGIKGERTHYVAFVVNHRRDNRHGVVGPPAPYDSYSQQLFKEMFRKW